MALELTKRSSALLCSFCCLLDLDRIVNNKVHKLIKTLELVSTAKAALQA